MESPKQKPKMTKPKVLDKSKTLMDKTRQSTDKPRERNADEYAVNKSEQTVQRSSEVVAHSIANAADKAMNKSREQIRRYRQTEYAKKFAGKQTTAKKTKHTAKNAIHTGKKHTAKTAKNTVKSTKKSIKNSSKGVKTAAKTTKKTAVVVKKSAVALKQAMAVAAKTAKTIAITSAKAIVTTIKATIAALKGLVAAIAAGGWIVLLVIVIVGVIIFVLASPFGLFSNQSDGETPTITELVQQINGEYANEFTNIITNAGEIDELIIEGETSSSDYTPNNWIDVLSVFAVKATHESDSEEYQDVLFLDDSKAVLLRQIFWSMNDISYEIIEEDIEPEPTPTPAISPSPSPTPNISPTPELTPEPTPDIYRTLIITATGKSYADGADIYGFDDEQMMLLEEMMSPYYIGMFMEICGMSTYIGLTPDQVAELVNNLPEGDLGATIVEYALSRLGHPYSQPRRGQGNYVDCSYFDRWCYQQAGVSNFIAGTAAEQARYCVDNGYAISKNNLIPGDLIFWSFNTNGRYLNITHVAIYAGDGYVIDASSSRGMVVYRPIFGESSIVVCGRPHLN